MSDAGCSALPPLGCDGDGWSPEELESCRRQAPINSLLIAGSTIDLDSFMPYGIAPDCDPAGSSTFGTPRALR
ncbi:hypothetical protein GCM10010336_75180 [Streptomyces goshikiensis]|nr:hypothetical protein GCM10010336_75180 [Streptomyces goshikiensis]